MDDPHVPLPGPRPPADTISASYPPAPRRWSIQAPVSQSRGGYISPEPSPTSEPPLLAPDSRQAFYQSDYFRSSFDNTHIHHQHQQQYRQQPQALQQQYRQSEGPVTYHPGPSIGSHGQQPLVQPQRPPPRPELDPFYYPVFPPRPVGGAHAKKARAVRKIDGKQPTFLTKLYQILEQPEYHHIIRWDEAGEVITIEKPDELAAKVLPLVYRQSRFASFSRQLNIYGFMRKVSLRHVDRGICDPDASTWSHPFLRRSSTAVEIQGFKRRVPPRPSQAAKRRASMASSQYDERGYALSPTSSEASYTSPDHYHRHLLQDLEEEKQAFFPSPPTNAMPLDGSSPESGPDVHRYTISNRPIQPMEIAAPAANLPMGAPPVASIYAGQRDSFAGGVPASAPAHIINFTPDLRIAQGHVRTRSVQGEPPTASIFSPLGQPPWPVVEHIEPAMRGHGGPPTYDFNDPSTWVRRGYIDINTGAPIYDVAPEDRIIDIQPASVPNDFAPIATYHSPPDVHMGGLLPITGASTISPGIYQAGFSMTTYKPTFAPTTPRAGPSRVERRSSLSSAPYSPRSKVTASVSFGGVVRGPGDRRGSSNVAEAREGGPGPGEGAGAEAGAGAGPAAAGPSRRALSPDEALPSAGLSELPRGPFEGFFGSDAGAAA